MRTEKYEKAGALSSSALSSFAKEMAGGEKRSKAMATALGLGGEFHRRVLEPHIEAEWEGTEKEELSITTMIERLVDTPSLMDLMGADETETEIHCYKDLDINGVMIPFKGILDIRNKKRDIGVDLKTTAASTYPQFMKSMDRFNYWSQAWIYKQVGGVNRFMFYAFEKKGKFMSFMIDVDQFPNMMALGEARVKFLAELYIEKNGLPTMD